MNLVVVNYCQCIRGKLIDNRFPHYSAPYSDVYWIPDNQLNTFITLARAEPNCTNVSVYQYKESHKAY